MFQYNISTLKVKRHRNSDTKTGDRLPEQIYDRLPEQIYDRLPEQIYALERSIMNELLGGGGGGG